jgi:hypothetical protein
MFAVLNADTGRLEEYKQLLKGNDKLLWEKGCSKEIARLAQGRRDNSVKGTNTLHFISFHRINYPKARNPHTYKYVPTIAPKKPIPTASVSPLAEISLITKAKHTRPRWISPLPSFFSTV